MQAVKRLTPKNDRPLGRSKARRLLGSSAQRGWMGGRFFRQFRFQPWLAWRLRLQQGQPWPLARTKLLRPLAMANMLPANREDKTKGEVMSWALAQLFNWPPFALMTIWFTAVGGQSAEGTSTLAAPNLQRKKAMSNRGLTDEQRQLRLKRWLVQFGWPGLGFQLAMGSPCEHGRNPDGPVCMWSLQRGFGCNSIS